MKVCQVCAVDFTLEKFLLPLVDGMIAEGWDVSVVCSSGSRAKSLRSQGYKINFIQINRDINIVGHMLSILRLWQFFLREKFDVVHVHTPVASLIGRIAAKLAGVNLIVYTAHGFYFHENMGPKRLIAYQLLERLLGLITDLLFLQSAEDEVTAKKLRIKDEAARFCIFNGINIRKYCFRSDLEKLNVRKGLGIADEAKVLGFVGRLVREKGLVELLEAVSASARQDPNLYLILIGQKLDSDHDAGVEDALASARSVMGERVVVMGQRDDVDLILKAMDVFCLPSWREGVPRSLIEAMATGVPVIATDIRGSRELIRHKQSGLLVKPKETSELKKAIEEVLTLPNEASSRASEARKFVEKYCDEDKIIDKQIDIIRNYHTRQIN